MLKKEKENKLTLRKTIQNDWYTQKMGWAYRKRLVINSLWKHWGILNGYFLMQSS